jgi:hypothetical protein
MLVSYTRARGEGLGVDLKGKGIAERAERILIIVILGFIPFQDNISVALWIISILAAITVLERLKVVSAKFGTPLFSLQTFRDMSSRNHEYESSSGTVTSRLNEPPTSLSKITKNVNDYLDKPNDKKMTTSNTYSKPSSTTTTTTTTKTPPPPPQPSSTTTKTPPPQPSSTTTKKAEFLDGTDPNETGRNVAHIIFDQEGEDEVYKKFTKSNTASNTSSNTEGDTSNTASNTSSNTEGDTSNTASNTSSNTEGDNYNDTKPATNEDKKPENNS